MITVGAASMMVSKVDLIRTRVLAEAAAACSSRASSPTSSLDHPELVGLQPGEVEQVVDQPLEPAHLLVDRDQRIVHVFGLDHAFGNRLDVAGDGGQRRTQLVGDPHQEIALQLVDLAQAVDHPLEPGGQGTQLVVGGVLR